MENFLLAAKKLTPLVMPLMNRWTVSRDSRINLRVVTTSLLSASTPKSMRFNKTLKPIFLGDHHFLEGKRSPVRDAVGQRGHSDRRRADLDDRDVFFGDQSELLENHPEDKIR